MTLPWSSVPFSKDSSSLSQAFLLSARFLDSTGFPSSFSTRMTWTSISSPTWRLSLGSGVLTKDNSLMGIIPSDFPPTSTKTSFSFIWTTVPEIMSPRLIFFRFSAKWASTSWLVASPGSASVIFSDNCVSSDLSSGSSIPEMPISCTSNSSSSGWSATGSSLISSWLFSSGVKSSLNSFILWTTSSIIQSGVEAPAVTPTRNIFLNHRGHSSSALSIWKVAVPVSSQTFASFRVFELLWPPITIIISTWRASSTAAFWRSRVAWQMVLKTFKSPVLSFNIFITSSKFSALWVVWATTPSFGKLGRFDASSGPSITLALPPVQPTSATTSGCALSPTTTTW